MATPTGRRYVADPSDETYTYHDIHSIGGTEYLPYGAQRLYLNRWFGLIGLAFATQPQSDASATLYGRPYPIDAAMRLRRALREVYWSAETGRIHVEPGDSYGVAGHILPCLYEGIAGAVTSARAARAGYADVVLPPQLRDDVTHAWGHDSICTVPGCEVC